MPRLDLMCTRCEHILEDVVVDNKNLKNGIVKNMECPACTNDIFSVYWGGGKAPGVAVKVTDSTELFSRCKTLGEFWDRKGIEIGGEKNKEASIKRIKKMREKKK